MKRGDIVEQDFGQMKLRGIVERAGAKEYRVLWTSNFRSRVAHDRADVSFVSDPMVIAEVKAKLGLPERGEVLWTGKIAEDAAEYRALLVDGSVVTESRPDRFEPWKAFTASGFGSTVRERILELAVLAVAKVSKRRNRA
jgi:hypothetical protein